MNFIEKYKNKLLFKEFEETKILIDKIKRNRIKQLYIKWRNHDCKYKDKGFCDICDEVYERKLYLDFVKRDNEVENEIDLLLNTRC